MVFMVSRRKGLSVLLLCLWRQQQCGRRRKSDGTEGLMNGYVITTTSHQRVIHIYTHGRRLQNLFDGFCSNDDDRIAARAKSEKGRVGFRARSGYVTFMAFMVTPLP